MGWIKLLSIMTLSHYCYGLAFSSDYDHHNFEQFHTPQRQFSVIVNDEGFYPDTLVAFAGEQVKIFATALSAKQQHCVAVTQLNFELKAEVGKVHGAELNVSDEGIYKISCPGKSYVGKLVVLGKRMSKVNQQREPASSEVDPWRPREY